MLDEIISILFLTVFLSSLLILHFSSLQCNCCKKIRFIINKKWLYTTGLLMVTKCLKPHLLRKNTSKATTIVCTYQSNSTVSYKHHLLYSVQVCVLSSSLGAIIMTLVLSHHNVTWWRDHPKEDMLIHSCWGTVRVMNWLLLYLTRWDWTTWQGVSRKILLQPVSQNDQNKGIIWFLLYRLHENHPTMIASVMEHHQITYDICLSCIASSATVNISPRR